MTTWDNIYKKFKNGGEAWATLSEDVHPLFKQFLGQSNFKHKYVFDVGCGTGKYLKFLQELGFRTDGMDSSKTSIEMTKKILGDNSKIELADMFKYNIEKNKYDLIISISTIHHGMKEKVQDLINHVQDVLIENGRTFITVPNFESSKKWNTFKDHDELSSGTFVPKTGPERDLPHSFFTKNEAQKLFLKFSDIKIELDEIGRWVVQATK